MNRASFRDVRVGVLVLAGVVGFLAMVSLAGGGPGFLARKRTIDVLFRNGQGVRVGCPVRVAGIDAGRVTGVDLAEKDGILQARVRLTVPSDLANRLRQDVRITVEASLTGTPCVNIVSSGRSEVALVPGQMIHGVESSMFDPVLEQVGLGPAERSHLSHTIAEVRQTVDAAGPRVRQIMASLQETVGSLRETADTVRPTVEATAGRVENIARTLDEAHLDETVRKVDALLTQADGLLTENRPVLQATLTNVNGLSADLRKFIAQDGPKVAALIEGINGTRVRVDHLLGQATIVATQGAEILTRNKVNLERTMSNVKEVTEHGVALVQKIRANPFYLSPFYKPTKDDVQAQEMYDAASTYLMAARELNDSVNRLQTMRSGKSFAQMNANEQQIYDWLYKQSQAQLQQMQQANQRLAEGLRDSSTRR